MSRESIERIYQNQLRNVSFRIHCHCESCGQTLAGHEWVDMDLNGYVVRCSRE